MSHCMRSMTMLLPFCLVVALAGAAFGNPVPNPGFEEGGDGKVAAWTLDAQPVTTAGVKSRSNGTARWDSESPHARTRCLTLESPGGENDHALVVSPEIGVVGGYAYEVSFYYQAAGLMPENGDRSRYAACILDVFQHGRTAGRLQRLGNTRILTYTNSEGWARLSRRFTPPPGTQTVQIRFALANKYPNSPVKIRIDDVVLIPLDADLPNPSLETGQGETPQGWSPVGGAMTAWAAGVARSGKRSLAVSDAPAGTFSGWATVVPVRPDRVYSLGGWIKGGDLAAHGPVGGGALALEFLDRDAQPLGSPVVSPAVGAKTDWTRVVTAVVRTPAGAASARLTAGLQFCTGTAWFDDMEFRPLAAAYGNHGVEQANSASPFRGGAQGRLSDEEYDTILAGLHDGIKAVDRVAPVLVGNIATDWEAKTVRRLYEKPAEGRFDGAILNAYLGILMTCRNNLKEFDAHGDRQKTVWQEETAEQRSPDVGEARRCGEGDGAKNMVRVWLSCVAGCGGRMKSFTQWGFAGSGDIFMVTENLQPRPQFVAHAVMADALADARFAGDRSQEGVSIFQWRRGDGPLLVAWANAGERNVTLQVAPGDVMVMDLMGNRAAMKSNDGRVSLKLTTSPVYLFHAGGE